MENLDKLSDDELRRRLLQYGLPNLPVTSTTRKILIKKLRLVMNGEKSKLRRETAYATRYSSDEDSSASTDTTDKSTTSSRSRATRATIATPSSNSMSNSRAAAVQQPNSAFVRPVSSPSAANSGHGTTRQPTLNISSRTSQSSASRPAQRSPVYVSPLIQGSSEDSDEEPADSRKHSVRVPTKRISLNNNNSAFTPISANSSKMNGQQQKRESSPYLSDFTQRLLNLRGTSAQADTNPSRPSSVSSNRTQTHLVHRTPYLPSNVPFGEGLARKIVSCEQPSNPSNGSAKQSSSSTVSVSEAFSSFVQKLDHHFGLKQSIVPCLLHAGFVLFFILVAVAYLCIKPDLTSTMRIEDAKFTTCPIGFDARIHSDDSLFTCIHQADVEPGLELLRKTAVELQRRAEVNRCEDANVPFVMGAKEVVKKGLEAAAGHSTVSRVLDQLHHMEYLIGVNPQWGISHCDAAGNRLEYDEIRSLRHSQLNYFAILQPRLPLKCKIYNKIQKFYTIVGSLALAVFLLYAAHALYKYIRNVRHARKQKVDLLIVNIIQELMEKTSAAGNDSDKALVVINHLRDKLIAPADRSKLAWAWKAAITFLEANESRIQFEVGTRNGEDCRMMRWSADPNMHSPRSSSVSPNGSRISAAGDKKWHCPAFDKSNKIKEPPTPCLKIRHMFESHETVTPGLRQTIQDAILEKVAGTGCRIYDVQLETNSCCVYVRCATPADAGIVHEQINGWWFDSRLVSIKFLHLDRYMNRFPNAASGPQLLQPSNTHNLSMSACNDRTDVADNEF